MRPLRHKALAVLLPLAWSPAFAQQVAPALPAAPTPLASSGLPAVSSRAVRDDLIASAESARKDERWIDALAIYEHLLAADPRDDVAYRMQAITLADLGASYRADELRAQWPSVFADFQRDRLQGDRVARAIGWGMSYPENADDPNAELRRAYDAVRELKTHPERTNWEKTRLRMDSLMATNALGMYQETIDEFEALKREGVDLPAYALGPAGDSYLALHRPHDAQLALQRAVELNPSDIDTQILLAYAYLEQERFDIALPMMQKLVESQPAWIQRAGAESDQANWRRYRAEMTYAQMISFGDDNARAQRIIEQLVRIGPNRSSTQAAMGSLMYRRGHPTAALERYDMALTLDPRNRDAEIGRVSALFETGRIDEAIEANRQVQLRYPKNLHAQRLQHEVDLRVGPIGRIGWVHGRNDSTSANGSPLGTQDYRFNFETWTPLIHNRWRLGIVGDTVDARFVPDVVRYRRIGGAVDYRFGQFGARVSAYEVQEPRLDGAWTVDGSWYLDDTWTLRASVADNDVDTTLQARRAGFKANSASIGASWRPSDLGAIDMRLKHLRYSDGNLRDQASAFGRWRLYTSPHLMIEGLGSGWWSRGSRNDAPYFNPSHDAMVTAGLRFNHMIWRHYDAYLRQRLDIEAGPYWQEGYGTKWVPSVAYRQEWRPAQGHTFEYGVSWAKPVYDGGRERRIAYELAYRWGF
ncbi:tetratricopeptide repeat protein [Cognatilysobacter lacus]|uniref:Tetratricopeptide repeat protein n=1 Tax=Cognatilysobacter lacus TaxID=1643323 RepID=A0A5D8Z313_9GAMM|nr:tetratricopeptide repeat protein [Lysobacter lacus]TZF88473.1 tetratricopeptide repeat protein [Lysobacter lacus]